MISKNIMFFSIKKKSPWDLFSETKLKIRNWEIIKLLLFSIWGFKMESNEVRHVSKDTALFLRTIPSFRLFPPTWSFRLKYQLHLLWFHGSIISWLLSLSSCQHQFHIYFKVTLEYFICLIKDYAASTQVFWLVP